MNVWWETEEIENSRGIFSRYFCTSCKLILKTHIERVAYVFWKSGFSTDPDVNWCEATEILTNPFYYAKKWLHIVEYHPLWSQLPSELINMIYNEIISYKGLILICQH